MKNTPVKPTLALSVGVIGHRPNRLPEDGKQAVEDQIDTVLTLLNTIAETVRNRYSVFFDEKPAHLTMISALADGADRMAARSALRNGLSLTSALPFPIADYETDFPEQASRDEYADLLARSSRTLVLPGNKEGEPREYDTVGRIILDNADIILAVWDSGPSGGRGGTTDLIERAAALGLPVIHLDVSGEPPPVLLWTELAEYPIAGATFDEIPSVPFVDAIGDVIDRMVRPPGDPDERAKLTRFLGERRKRFNWRIEVPVTLALLGLRGVRRTDLLPTSPHARAESIHSLPDAASSGGVDANSEPLDAIGEAYGAADALAVRYAQVFRGAYVSIFLFSALAVIVAALALVGQQLFDWDTAALAVLQIALVALVLIYTGVGRKRDWHGRWREAREVAERLRAAIPLWLLGETREDSTGTEPTWSGWFVRGHLRGLGLWSGVIDRQRLESIRIALIALVDGQRDYHKGVVELMTRIEQRLLRLGQILFALTFLLGAINLVLAFVGVDLPFNWHYTMIGITAALPALGSATFGIRLIGDFEGVAQRSARSAASMAAISTALAQDPPELMVLRSRAGALTDAMLGDIAHWRMATETRKLVAPV
jgi:hypothetical protein